MLIHPSAIVSPKAEFGKDVDIGPFAIVEDNVRIGDGTRLRARAHICAGSTLGKNCDIHMNAAVGHAPQDFSYKGDPIHTRLGDGVVLRENVTVHGGSAEKPTLIGDKSYLMVNSHVAHNCVLGKNVLLVNGALLAGHVQIDDGAIISGNVGIHQFVRIGKLAMLAGGIQIGMDVPPYMVAMGVNSISALNKVGLRRASFLSVDDREEIKRAFKILYRSDLELPAALERLKTEFKSPAIQYLVEFMSVKSARGFCRYALGVRRGAGLDTEKD